MCSAFECELCPRNSQKQTLKCYFRRVASDYWRRSGNSILKEGISEEFQQQQVS